MTRLLLLLPLLALAACLSGEECEIGNWASGVCAASSFCLAP